MDSDGRLRSETQVHGGSRVAVGVVEPRHGASSPRPVGGHGPLGTPLVVGVHGDYLGALLQPIPLAAERSEQCCCPLAATGGLAFAGDVGDHCPKVWTVEI